MKTIRILLGAFVLAILIAVGLWLRHQLRVDSCLDRGGRWVQTQQICEETKLYIHLNVPVLNVPMPAAEVWHLLIEYARRIA